MQPSKQMRAVEQRVKQNPGPGARPPGKGRAFQNWGRKLGAASGGWRPGAAPVRARATSKSEGERRRHKSARSARLTSCTVVLCSWCQGAAATRGWQAAYGGCSEAQRPPRGCRDVLEAQHAQQAAAGVHEQEQVSREALQAKRVGFQM